MVKNGSENFLMCGRFVLSSDADRLSDHYGLDTVPIFSGGYNIAPSAQVPVVRRDPDRELALCHWGFIPHWVKEPVLKPINARAETLTGKPYFRDAFKRRRCLVPGQRLLRVARGETGGKQPYFHSHGGDGPVFLCGALVVLAGAGRAGGELRYHHDIGTGRNWLDIHDRMPVIIAPEDYDAWLEDGGQDLLRPCAGEMAAYPVSRRVNNPRNQGEALIQPVG